MSISPLQRSLFQLTARQSRLAREARLHAPIAGARRRGKRRRAWQRERNSQRSGQALLLAVLLMVFAALLGSTFITVVSLNLNQTARQQNLGSAQAAANAGLTLINDKLNNSALGERWRPYMTTPPPSAATDPVGFDNYYSAFDRAQGWTNNVDTVPQAGDDRNGNTITYGAGNASEKREEEWLFIDEQLLNTPTKHLFVKFPDPRGAVVQTGSPQFLAELRPNADGTVRLDVIGQSADDPGVFVRETRTKPGAAQNPLVAVARTVTNWDFTNNVVPSAFVQPNATGDPTNVITIGNRRGDLPPFPFYITIGGLAPSSNLQSALVTGYGADATKLVLSQNPTAAVTANDFVQVAAALGTPTAVDYDADGTQKYGVDANPNDPVNHTRTFDREAVAYTPDVRKSASILVNGGLTWMGNVLPTRLGLPSVAGADDSFIRASGLITQRDQVTMQAGAPVTTTAYPQAINIKGSSLPANLLPSDHTDFPFVVSAVPNAADKAKIVTDGHDRLQGNSDGLRNADSIKPPDISSGGSFSRYLNLTKYSPSIVAGQPSGALFGYGEGIYVDNESDKEKFSVPGTQWQLMDEVRFRRMLFSTEFNTTANANTAQSRLCKPYGVTQVTGTGPNAVKTSLEQKHLRGWIGPDEFRARGVLIELDPRNQAVIITRDDLSDDVTSTDVLPDDKKAWRAPDGTLSPYYRRVLPWPANGVIYAEGNVRVKGGAFDLTTGAPLTDRVPTTPDPQRSITIVSGSNIFVEGSLNAGQRKVVLLAKKNVVVNPTAVLSRNTAQAKVVSSTGGGSVLTLAGNDALMFELGDWVEINNSQPRRITAINPVANSITVNNAFSAPVTKYLRAIRDPYSGSGGTKFPFYGSGAQINIASDVIQRRFRLPVGSPAVRLALRHSAQRIEAFDIQANNGTPPIRPNIDLTNKVMTNPTTSTLIPGVAASKLIKVDYGASLPPLTPVLPAGMDQFPTALPGSGTDLNTNPAFRLTEAAAAPTTGIEPQMENAHTAPDFEYDKAVTGPTAAYRPTAVSAAPTGPLYFFLAALGNRFPIMRTPTGTLPRSEDIRGIKKTLLMATSVAFYSNLSTAPSDITNDPLMGGSAEVVSQFGFSPRLDAPEDALTGDESFYTGVGLTPDPDLVLNTGDIQHTYDARRIAVAATGLDNHIALKLDNENVRTDNTTAGDTGKTVADYFDGAPAKLPYYRMSRMKIDGPLDPYNGTATYASLQPGSGIDIHAFAYAQEGRWLVIPGGHFDEYLKYVPPAGAVPASTVLDDQVKTDAQGPFIDYKEPGRNNADGTVDTNNIERTSPNAISAERSDKLIAYRFRRYNYQIVFTGAIMEKTTAVIATEGNTEGQVSSWMDKWATFNFDAANPAGSDFDDSQPDSLKATLISQARYVEIPPAAGTSANFGNISYNFDTDFVDPAVTNFVVDGSVIDSGLRLPVLPDLLPG